MKVDLVATKQELAKKTMLCQDVLEEQGKLTIELDEVMNEKEILEEDCRADKERIAELESDAEVRDTSIAQLKQDIEIRDSEIRAVTESLQQHEHDLLCREADVKSLETRMQTARVDHDNEKFKFEEEFHQMKVLYHQACQKCEVYGGEISEMKSVISDYVVQVKQLSKQCESVREELEKKRADIADLRQVFGEKEDDLESQLEEVTMLSTQLQKAKSELEKERNSLVAEVRALKEKLKTCESGETILKENHERDVTRLQRELDSVDASLKDARQRIGELDKTLKDTQDDLSEQITKYHKAVAALTSELDSKNDGLERTSRKISGLESDLADSHHREAELSKKLICTQDLRNEMEASLTTDLTNLQRMYEERDAEAEEVSENMMNQVDHLMNQKHEVLTSRDELVRLVENLQEELDKVGGVMEQQEAQLQKEAQMQKAQSQKVTRK